MPMPLPDLVIEGAEELAQVAERLKDQAVDVLGGVEPVKFLETVGTKVCPGSTTLSVALYACIAGTQS